MVFIEITLRYGCSSVKLLHVCRTTIFKNTFGRLPQDIQVFALTFLSLLFLTWQPITHFQKADTLRLLKIHMVYPRRVAKKCISSWTTFLLILFSEAWFFSNLNLNGLDSERKSWTLDSGSSILNPGRWTLDCGR